MCTPIELSELKGLCYVLQHVRSFDSVAQATTQATGVKYCRIISKALERLAYIATNDSNCCSHFEALPEKERRVTIGVVDKFDKRQFKYMALL